jgi:FSR family fosmidomycin resistance protein-like MFS transporter
MRILVALSFSHLLNDTIQSLIPALYPIFKETYALNFAQIGLITFAFQCTASLLQPLIGIYTDRHPKPFSLAIGMGVTLVGLVLLSFAGNYAAIVVASALVGVGSAVFHPEASRVAKTASGGRFGFAQSFFQVGGNTGTALGALLAATVVGARGQSQILWFALIALIGIFVLSAVGRWYKAHLQRASAGGAGRAPTELPNVSPRRVFWSIVILLALIFSKYFYLVSLTSYYTFYLIGKFHVPVETAQLCLFVFLGSVAAGTYIGGPVGDKIGRKYVIWVSILGVAPFTLVLPHVNFFWTVVLTIPIGVILASAMSAILVYAQELLPGRTGMVAGLFFGFAFGIAGVGSAVLGKLADRTSIDFVYNVCAFLPLIGLLTAFLPNFERPKQSSAGLGVVYRPRS